MSISDALSLIGCVLSLFSLLISVYLLYYSQIKMFLIHSL